MIGFDESPGFFGFLKEVPLFFKLFGGFVITVVASTFLYVIVRGIRTWIGNNASEAVTRSVTIVDKRTEVWGGSGDSSASTDYYITFEMDDRSRIELAVRADRYGLIVVGDQGELTHQGTRFKQFHRHGIA
ncbi:hypothetical protein FHS16_004071 [Paenibacillus endophyticus]|uniref:DUF2500 domain-containing protein n=1 Tax=Paenibacillus endophyticus TaxID=1294268 RepID=A0A7W5CAA2_9BACL|nr:DUF2500 domain-containing protein [Paenibacillus endophyticus]MBB3153995.1 hypothetical protein [Paenibacillus endophyticus]